MRPSLVLAKKTLLMPFLKLIISVILLFFSKLYTCSDTITSTKFINDPEAVISSGNIFKLGFFSPVNTTKRYVGIFYVSGSTALWVANRETHLNDSAGSVTISEDGNLVVLDGQKKAIWSSNITNSFPNSFAQILDSGNLVLRDNLNGNILWESFKHPMDSFLLDMRVGTNIKTNEMQLLTSWKSASDPSSGKYSVGLVPLNIPQLVIWNGGDVHWRSGPWNGQTFIGIPDIYAVYLSGVRVSDDTEGGFTLYYAYTNETSRLFCLLNYDGNLVGKSWMSSKQDWEDTWLAQRSQCDTYGKCGLFGTCDSRGSPVCTCLRGFEPNSLEEWGRGNWSGGCKRRIQLKCDRSNSITEEGREDGFLRIRKVKVPDSAELSVAFLEEDCRNECIRNCSCIGYAFHTGNGCMKWKGSLIDIQRFHGSSGVDIYLRLAFSELDKSREKKAIVAAITVTLGSIIVSITAYICWNRMAKRKGKDQENEVLLSRSDSISQAKFEFEDLANATRHFHSANKLGEGGFGSVYKGEMPDGQEIAVKRLSRSSGQGLEEFMNEVTVISKLQHRNLVKLLGCCVKGEEKMLVYEYMPNRSLDALIFDPLGSGLLTWSKRKNIIEGIGRGLLYLHRDSRLKIIHRDLKTSNILLDGDLNPKISDFGMARIFGSSQDHEKTKRVVGTYGYMSPEYAMKGTYSEKSDVYSFGVILLEIISGKKSTHLHTKDQKTLSLLGLTWKLWTDEKISDLIDPWMFEPCFRAEILRYIHVGLLCVQESAKDRPNVSNLLWMFGSESEDLPKPKQPAFTERETSSQDTQKMYSANKVTITILEGR